MYDNVLLCVMVYSQICNRDWGSKGSGLFFRSQNAHIQLKTPTNVSMCRGHCPIQVELLVLFVICLIFLVLFPLPPPPASYNHFFFFSP